MSGFVNIIVSRPQRLLVVLILFTQCIFGLNVRAEALHIGNCTCTVPEGYSSKNGTVYFNRNIQGIPSFSVGSKSSDIYKGFFVDSKFSITWRNVVNNVPIMEIGFSVPPTLKGKVHIADFGDSYVLFSKSERDVSIKFLESCYESRGS
jgi:hypothetical protein